MIHLGKLSDKQKNILRHLVKRGHAMTSPAICMELRLRYIGVDTLGVLRDKKYIRPTDQGWLATDAGRLRVSDGM